MQFTCKQCGRPIYAKAGHRTRRYCNGACKQLAYRRMKLEKRRDVLRQQWNGYSPLAQERLETLMRIYGEDAALLAIDALKHL
jgi:hypothetical protein